MQHLKYSANHQRSRGIYDAYIDILLWLAGFINAAATLDYFTVMQAATQLQWLFPALYRSAA